MGELLVLGLLLATWPFIIQAPVVGGLFILWCLLLANTGPWRCPHCGFTRNRRGVRNRHGYPVCQRCGRDRRTGAAGDAWDGRPYRRRYPRPPRGPEEEITQRLPTVDPRRARRGNGDHGKM
jgi:hypothetical protein